MEEKERQNNTEQKLMALLAKEYTVWHSWTPENSRYGSHYEQLNHVNRLLTMS